jgi:hypothetical protein
MKEVWKDIKNYSGYRVSNLGRVKSFGFRKVIIRKLGVDKNGYLVVCLYKNKGKKMVKVHRLVAQAFISNPENKPEVNHKDGNKQNNCVDNLEWATASENQMHSYNVLDSVSRRQKIGFLMKGRFESLHPKWKGRIKCSNGRIYSSAQKVCDILEIDQGNLSKVLNGKRKTVNGLIFEYIC